MTNVFPNRQQAVEAESTRLNEIIDALVTSLRERQILVPPEIIRLVSFVVPFTIPSPDRDVHVGTEFSVTCPNFTPVQECWLVTGPLDQQSLLKSASVQLITMSGHQNWTTHPHEGSWSWFEVAIIPASSTKNNDVPSSLKYSQVKRRSDGTFLAWESHRHPVYLTAPITKYEGVVFEAGHELWQYLKPGDRLAVFGCANHPMWSCRGERAVLTFDEYFDPCE